MRPLRRRLACGFVAALTLGCGGGSTDPATILTLQNDALGPGAVPAFQAWFANGDGIGASFGARSSSYRVREVSFLFGGSATPQTVTLTFYTVLGPTRTPIYSDDFPLTPSDVSLQEIDLTGADVEIPAGTAILVAVLFQHDGLPGPAIDENGRTPGGNWLYVSSLGSWKPQEDYLVDGDWILRVEIEED